jgi:hypothetical protein
MKYENTVEYFTLFSAKFSLNHLLKLPFTVHPKTGKIAVPLNAKLISNLDLEQLPQVVKLTTELIENSAKQKGLEMNKGKQLLKLPIFFQFIVALLWRPISRFLKISLMV